MRIKAYIDSQSITDGIKRTFAQNKESYGKPISTSARLVEINSKAGVADYSRLVNVL